MKPTLEMPPLPPAWQRDPERLPRVREIAARLFGGACIHTRHGYATEAGGKYLVQQFGRNTVFDTPEEAAYLAICHTIVEKDPGTVNDDTGMWE